MNAIVINILIVGGISFFSAIILYWVSQKFSVRENPKIKKIESLLPNVNCGGCGKAGCHDFALSCVKADKETFAKLYCTVGGQTVMEKIGRELGFEVAEHEALVAVLRCNGTCENAPSKFEYVGLKSCRMAARITTSQSECPTGCVRFGDCVKACKFGALKLSKETGMPVVDTDKCIGCGACVRICPKQLFELRPRGKDNERVYVACRNTQKGAEARKNCKVACIACQKCAKICNEIKIENNLSYIPSSVDAQKYGKQLADACPTGAIHYTGKKEG